MKNEFPYVEFLKMRKVALEEYKSENTDQEIKDFTPEIQSLMKQDKDLIDKS